MNLQKLIEALQARTEDLEEEVEFVVVTKEGRIIVLDLSSQAATLKKVLKRFAP